MFVEHGEYFCYHGIRYTCIKLHFVLVISMCTKTDYICLETYNLICKENAIPKISP